MDRTPDHTSLGSPCTHPRTGLRKDYSHRVAKTLLRENKRATDANRLRQRCPVQRVQAQINGAADGLVTVRPVLDRMPDFAELLSTTQDQGF
jgi:hypothetical protein